MKYLTIVMALFATACAPMTEQQREAREYREMDYQAKFLDYQSQCLQSGGIVYIDAINGMKRNGTPRLGARYSCGPRRMSF